MAERRIEVRPDLCNSAGATTFEEDRSVCSRGLRKELGGVGLWVGAGELAGATFAEEVCRVEFARRGLSA
jgi:hypothetical protein